MPAANNATWHIVDVPYFILYSANAALRAVLASGELGQHNGLPATIIVSTTLKDLESAAGKALTGGPSGSITPSGWPHQDNE